MRENLERVEAGGVLAPEIARQRLETAGSLRWFHWLIVGFSFGLTLLAWHYANSEKNSRVKAQFDREADQVLELVRERMGKYEDALWSGVALIQANGGEIDLTRWQTYAESIDLEDKYDGINGIGVIHALPKEHLPIYQAAQREQRPEFKVYPEHDGAEAYPITYIIPVQGNEKAIGLDIAHEANRYQAATQARDTGLSQVTGPITLVQDQGKTAGFLFYAPFYSGGSYPTVEERRTHFKGLVYAPFVVRKLMQGVLQKEKRHVGIRLLDGRQVLYDEHRQSEPDFDPDPMFVRQAAVQMYGRTWTFDIWSAKSFRDATIDHQPLTILASGVVIDSLIILLFLMTSRTSSRALNYAQTMTRELERNYARVQNEIAERKRVAAVLQTVNASLRESQTKLRGLFDQSSTFVGLMSTAGMLLEANRTALKAAGLAEADVCHRPFWETPWWTHSPELQQRLREAISQAAEGQAVRFEATHVGSDGSLIYVDFSLTPIKDEAGEVVFLIPEGRDITALKRHEVELQNLLAELRTSNKELEQFAYIASHDLQEPLRKIASYAQLLREEYGEQLGEEGNRYLDVVIGGAERLKRLVSDLLSFSRITTRGQPLVPTDANDALQGALEQLEVSILECQAEISHAALPEVVADESQLMLLFQNLVGNAIKYRSDESPRIEIGFVDLGPQYEFYVKDNGIGIDDQFHARVFEIFQRLHNRREYSGTGIGLAICKRIVERFGGHMRIESAVGQGSAFYFTLDKVRSSVPLEEPGHQLGVTHELCESSAS